MTFRCRKLLDLARDMPCFIDWPHECTAYLGCEPMHSDSHIFGRGHGHKSHDFAFASGCHNGHKAITAKIGEGHEQEAKFYCWLRAYAKTQAYLWQHKKVKVA